MQQYFIKGQAQSPIQVTDKDTIKHMFSVMRLTTGDKVILVFDDEIKRLARLVDKETHTFELLEEYADRVELPIDVAVAVGFPKGDKLEFLAQKVTELGAKEIWAFPAEWSVVKWEQKKLVKKTEKLEKISLGAAEQSKRNRVPAVQLFDKQSDFLAHLADFDSIIVAYEESAKQGENAALVQVLTNLKKGSSLLLVFGPEGGLSPAEITRFQETGATLVGLGPRIMRAETAPLYALSAISVLTELMDKKR